LWKKWTAKKSYLSNEGLKDTIYDLMNKMEQSMEELTGISR